MLRAASPLPVAIPGGIPEAARPRLTMAATAPTRRLRTTTIVPRVITIQRPTGITPHQAATTRLRTAVTRRRVRTHPPRHTRLRGAAVLHRVATQHHALPAVDSAAVVRVVVVAVEADSTVAVVGVADRTLEAVVEVADRTLEAVEPLTAVVAITNSNIL